jgi:hypothetical protein
VVEGEGAAYATIAPSASSGFRRITSLKLVFRMTCHARAESVLMACHSMPLRDGDGLGACPACLYVLSGSWLRGDVDCRRYWELAGSVTRANGICCWHRGCCNRRTRGDVYDWELESRSAPADRRPAARGKGIVTKLGLRAQLGVLDEFRWWA